MLCRLGCPPSILRRRVGCAQYRLNITEAHPQTPQPSSGSSLTFFSLGFLGNLYRMPSMYAPLVALSSCLITLVQAEVTIYGLTGQTTLAPVVSGTVISASGPSTTSFVTTPGPPQYTGLAAYNPVYMVPPPIPSPAPANQFTIDVPSDAKLINGLSVPQQGSFFGFSIEMSVANQLSESLHCLLLLCTNHVNCLL